MVAEGYDDCEGDLPPACAPLLAPDVPISVTLDPHSFTQLMKASADVLIAQVSIPHIDASRARVTPIGSRSIWLMTHPRPTIGVRLPDGRRSAHHQRTDGRVRPAAAVARRRDGVLSVSCSALGSSGRRAGSRRETLVVTDDDLAKADALAAQLAREFWALRATRHALHGFGYRCRAGSRTGGRGRPGRAGGCR